jgi:predicted ATP-grasp superfamily ATP-dependent carboligase
MKVTNRAAMRPTATAKRGETAKPGALIIGGAHGSLAIARSLGRQGIPVWFLTDDHPITKFSRYCQRSFRWNGPQSETALCDLLEFAAKHDLAGWVLFAGGDPEVRLICQHHAELSAVFRLTTPPWEVARYAHDKRLTHERAVQVGVDYPLTRYPQSLREVAEVPCAFPLILKPTFREGRDPFTSAKAWRVDTREQLVTRYAEAEALVGREAISLQELIPGGGEHQYSYAAVWSKGEPVVSLTARRKRQYPIDFGYTSTCVEVVERPEVEEAACRFLKSLAYDGLVEVEFKYDAREDRYKLLDVNARAWTWNALGGVAGADFPLAAWGLAIGDQVAPARGRPGAVWYHVVRDVIAACHEMARGDFSALKPRAGRGPVVYAALSTDDPVPGILDLPLTAWRALTRRLIAPAGPDEATPKPVAKLPDVAPGV